jgi:hypothetical protein
MDLRPHWRDISALFLQKLGLRSVSRGSGLFVFWLSLYCGEDCRSASDVAGVFLVFDEFEYPLARRSYLGCTYRRQEESGSPEKTCASPPVPRQILYHCMLSAVLQTDRFPVRRAWRSSEVEFLALFSHASALRLLYRLDPRFFRGQVKGDLIRCMS